MFEIIEFKSEWKTLLGLNKVIWMWKNNIKNLDLNKTKIFLLEKEKEILQLPAQHDGSATNLKGVTARSNQFNLFNYDNEHINKIKIFIQDNVKGLCNRLNIPIEDFYIMCWYNVLRENEIIHKHVHYPLLKAEESFISGHLCISANNTHTYYNSICDQPMTKVKNDPGLLNFFPGYLPHYTDAHAGKDARITIAMDIYSKKKYANPKFLETKTVIPLFN